MVREMQRRLGDASPITIVPWARGLALALKQRDVALFPTARTPEREHLFHWVGPIGRNDWSFYKRRGDTLTIKSLEDAKRVEGIAVYQHDARHSYLRKLGFTNLQDASNNILNIRKLLHNRVDLIACSNLCPMQLELALRQPSELIEEALVFRRTHLYLAFSKKTDEETVSTWGDAYAAMIADGTFHAIHEYWLPGVPSPLQ